jgi:hypothetical protein
VERALAATMPEDLVEIYRLSGGLELFRPVEGLTWGMRLFSPQELLTEGLDKKSRYPPGEFIAGDIVFARFWEDDHWLLVRGDRSADDFGAVLYIPEIVYRPDWPMVAPDIATCLQEYVRARGQPRWPDWGDAGEPLA